MQSYSDLPKEITYNILYRLPAKSIGLCRCVAKSWRALLSTPSFIRTHLEVSRNFREESLPILEYSRSSARFYIWYASLSDARHLFDKITISAIRLRFADHSNSWSKILASCDGLFLLEDCERGKFVLNPITREIRKVAVSPFAVFFRQCYSIYGFGYESVTDDYKIVTIYHNYDEDDPHCTLEMFVDVYSLRTNIWKNTESLLHYHPLSILTRGAYANGYIHWPICRKIDGEAIIMAFDMLQEKFHKVPPPRCDFGDFDVIDLLGGHLCKYRYGEPDFWVMKEYGVQQSWTKIAIDKTERR